ncbi:type VII secretion protein EccB [Verrucosispora sp. TAA-831]|uniref:type VII secretion protein EccB n=1 Tax=Verrucosispora sp. TAA-831 TaxID=3422227 RepID=UPI003D6F0B8F
MQSRRDQVQAQSYVLGRLTGALVAGEPETPENPHRRILVGSLAGLLVAALVVAGFAVYGFLRPGGADSWRAPRQLVVEKETGSRYVLVDGTLRPVLNYTSARLIFGAVPKVVSVSGRSLADVPRGRPLGIVGAPDALPAPGALAGTAWHVCAQATRDGAGTPATTTTLAVDRSATDTPLPAEQAVVARVAAGPTFLVWQGRRFALTRDWLSRAFGYDGVPVLVEPGWLEQLPVGPDLAPVPVPDRGRPGPEVDGRPTRIGQLFVVRVAGLPERHYLLHRDGLSQLGPLAHGLVESDPDTARAYRPAPVAPTAMSPAALARLPVSAQPTVPADLPPTPPTRAEPGPGRVWCVRHTDGGGIGVTSRPPLTAPAARTVDGTGVTRTARTAGAVSVAPGVGGLVRLGRPGQLPGTGYFLVTDAGIKYPLADPSVAEVLGYPLDGAATVTRGLLDLLPTGPLLDPELARK